MVTIDPFTAASGNANASDPDIRIDRAIAAALEADRARRRVAAGRLKALKSMQNNAVALDELSRRLCAQSIAEARAADELLERVINSGGRADHPGNVGRAHAAAHPRSRTTRARIAVVGAVSVAMVLLVLAGALRGGW